MLCENTLFLRLLNYFNVAMSVLRFGIPMLLLIKLTFDAYKGIINPNDNDGKEKIARRIFASVIIFLIPTIVNIFLGFMEGVTGNSFNCSECTANDKNIKYYEERRELEKQLEETQANEESYVKYQALMIQLEEEMKNKQSASDSVAITIGQKFNLSDSELTNVAKVCQREQGRPEGAAAEAELMINKYILSGYKGSFYSYLFNSGYGRWWSPIKHNNYRSTKLRAEIKEAVRKVVNEGYRTMPAYINEHDCFDCNSRKCSNGNKGDICSLEINGQKITSMSQIKSRSSSYYIPNVTKVHTLYNQTSSVNYWVFYKFPDAKSDPFGYTLSAKEKIENLNK